MTDAIQHYTRAPDLEVHETADGLIVFNSTTDRVHHLNHAAGVLFELCQEAHDSNALVTMMAELYALDERPDEAITTGLQQLVKEGVLIETGDE